MELNTRSRTWPQTTVIQSCKGHRDDPGDIHLEMGDGDQRGKQLSQDHTANGCRAYLYFFPPPGLGIFSKVPQLLVTYADANLGLREIQRVRAGDKEVLFSN